MATRAVEMQVLRSKGPAHGAETLAVIESDLQKELEEGRAWYADLRERELSWIREGRDPEVEFDKLYDAEPEVSGMDVRDPLTLEEMLRLLGRASAAIALLLGALGIGYAVWRVRRNRALARRRPGHAGAARPAPPSGDVTPSPPS